MTQKTLKQIVAEKPFYDYATWWPMGQAFLNFMSEAIVSQWAALGQNEGRLEQVRDYAAEYLATVFGREAKASLVEDFSHQRFAAPLQSGEFEALSYAFFRSAFELIAQQPERYALPLERERRLFTRRVGRVFFNQLDQHLKLELPGGLNNEAELAQLKTAIDRVGDFLHRQGYLRDHFAFYFEVTAEHAGRQIHQPGANFLADLQQNGLAYALYEMGYPAILPSAVYLFQTLGEAQHHSSRIIEELFARVGYEARETDDFDPSGYPSDRVVELWEIRPAANV